MVGCVTGLLAEMLLLKLNSVPDKNTCNGMQDGCGQHLMRTDVPRCGRSQQALLSKSGHVEFVAAMPAALD